MGEDKTEPRVIGKQGKGVDRPGREEQVWLKLRRARRQRTGDPAHGEKETRKTREGTREERRSEVYRPEGQAEGAVGGRAGGTGGQPHTHRVKTVPHDAAGCRAGREMGWGSSDSGCGSKISTRD